jgi:hypothetical protein
MENSSLQILRNALANRRRRKALELRLAIRKAEAQQAVYGPDKAAALWDKAIKAQKSVDLLTPPTA